MGRQSPGKWIRNLLLGKKSTSKPNSTNKKESFKPSINKDVVVEVSSEASMSIPNVSTSSSISGADATKGVVSENEVVSGSSSNDMVLLSIGDEQANAQDLVNIGSEDHPEQIRLTEAAILAQAAFRGYQARRMVRTLKGVIVPLQALIRGQLVRREAVCALYCVKGIVKFQALARGYRVRHSDIGIQVQKICKDTKCSNSIGVVASTKAEKLSDNVYVHKLLASSTSSVSPHLKYGYREPNLAWEEWLDRWTRSHFWAPLPELKKLDSVSDEKNETNKGQVERNAPAARADDDGSIPRKDSSIPLHSQKENKKSNSNKSSNSKNEKRKHITRKSSNHTATDVSKQVPSDSSEKMKDLAVPKSKHFDLEKSLGHQAENVSHNDTNGKNLQRRASLPGNFTCHNKNELQNTPSPRVPSYMAPTESAKARLRGHGSPRLVSDLVDKNSINRRLSLSSSLNGKLGLFSPTSERLVAMGSKGFIKTDRSLSSSRDWTDKLIQPQWRR